MQWYALRVKSNMERAVALHLSAKGYDSLVPIQTEAGHVNAVHNKLLFPGYVLCRCNAEKRLPILMIPGVVHLVSFGRIPAPIEESEVASLRILMASRRPLLHTPFRTGEKVLVQNGCFKGATGIVTRIGSSERLIVSIALLQRSVCVELPGAYCIQETLGLHMTA